MQNIIKIQNRSPFFGAKDNSAVWSAILQNARAIKKEDFLNKISIKD